jgi:hypothetical protein
MFCSRRTTWLLVFLGLFFAVTLTFAEESTEEYVYPDDNDECEEDSGKENTERRHGEPFIFLFLPKMGLLAQWESTLD